MLNGPKNSKCKTCKANPPNRTVAWQAKGLAMNKRKQDGYWATVCYAGISGNPGMVGAADWTHMGWGMGVSLVSGDAGGKGIMRKRARDNESGTLYIYTEKAVG